MWRVLGRAAACAREQPEQRRQRSRRRPRPRGATPGLRPAHQAARPRTQLNNRAELVCFPSHPPPASPPPPAGPLRRLRPGPFTVSILYPFSLFFSSLSLPGRWSPADVGYPSMTTGASSRRLSQLYLLVVTELGFSRLFTGAI